MYLHLPSAACPSCHCGGGYRAAESRVHPLRLPWQPRILRLQYQNRWHRNAENHYHQAYIEGFAVLYLFLPGKLMASTARLSFFYRHHSAYRIQEMPNHNSSTWENESELIHFFESRFLDESEVIHSWECTNLYVCRVRFPSFWGRHVLLA